MIFVDLTGRRFGSLLVEERAGSRTGKVLWRARCDCGGVAEVVSGDLLRKDGKARVSCGCRNHLKGRSSSAWVSPNDVPATYFSKIRRSAERRGLKFDLSIKHCYRVLERQKFRCALSGREIGFGESRRVGNSASLDRVDSSDGYVAGNIQWLHKDINRLKSDWPESQFVLMCKEVARHAR